MVYFIKECEVVLSYWPRHVKWCSFIFSFCKGMRSSAFIFVNGRSSVPLSLKRDWELVKLNSLMRPSF